MTVTDYDPRITAETWDLAELKWKSLAAGAADAGDIHPELRGLRYQCSFCSLFNHRAVVGGHCAACPLRAGAVDDWEFGHCCDGRCETHANDQTRKRAGAVLRYIRDKRRVWEVYVLEAEECLNTPPGEGKDD